MFFGVTRMSRWNLVSMVRINGVISPPYKWDINWGDITHFLTFDPNFLGHPSKKGPLQILSMSHPGWLINRDPYFMVYEIIRTYNWVV